MNLIHRSLAAVASVALLALPGCVNKGEWARLNSVGHVGCGKNEIRATEVEVDGYSGASNWTAWCGRQAYYCQHWSEGAMTDTGQRGTVCTPRRATSGGSHAAAPAHAAAPSGCTRDTDCKGERVCEQGQCVAPVPAAEPSAVPPEPIAEPASAEPPP